MSNTIKSISMVCVLGVLGMGSAGSYAYTSSCPDTTAAYPMNGCSLGGLVDGSFPYFNNVVAVKSKAKFDKEGAVKKFGLTATQYKGSVDNWFVLDQDTSYLITKPKYTLSANFLSETEAEGDLKISGAIDLDGDGKISKSEKFKVTAVLEGSANYSEDGMLWGFNTAELQCSGVINDLTTCTDGEVAYLNLLDSILPNSDFKKINTAGRAISSVPLPAAVWLFGSGLLGLISVSRRAQTREQR